MTKLIASVFLSDFFAPTLCSFHRRAAEFTKRFQHRHHATAVSVETAIKQQRNKVQLLRPMYW